MVQPNFQKNVTINMGQEFLRAKIFLSNYRCHTIFNNSTKKLFYSCTPNIGMLFRQSNWVILKLSTLKTKLKNVTARAKRRNMDLKVSRRVIDKATPYNIHKGGSAFCNLCVLEKYYILTAKFKNSLKSRNELINKCRHLNRFSVENFPCKPNG